MYVISLKINVLKQGFAAYIPNDY